jgi:hypothetical protein
MVAGQTAGGAGCGRVATAAAAQPRAKAAAGAAPAAAAAAQLEQAAAAAHRLLTQQDYSAPSTPETQVRATLSLPLLPLARHKPPSTSTPHLAAVVAAALAASFIPRIPAAQPAGFPCQCSLCLLLAAAACWVQAAANGEHSSDPGSPWGGAPAVAGAAATSAGAVAQPLSSLVSQQPQQQQHEHQLRQQQRQQQQQQQFEVRCPCS